jgi:hypothetical protein
MALDRSLRHGTICFATYLLKLGFTEAKSNNSLFIYHSGSEKIYLLYVGDSAHCI